MPRPRVHPSQRRRAAEACNYCREAKKKCSGTAPCTHCQRRGIGDTCIISLQPRSRRSATGRSEVSPPSRPAVASGLPSSAGKRDNGSAFNETSPYLKTPRAQFANTREHLPSDPSDAAGLVSPLDSRFGNASDISIEKSDTQHRPSDASSVPGNPHARMLLNLRGERVYIGGAASLSFLELVRSIVADQIGPSQFSHNDKSDTMLEKESPVLSRAVPILGVADLDVETKVAYSQCYHAVTEGFMDIFTSAEIDDYLMRNDAFTSPKWSSQKRAALDMVMAIGAQCKSVADARDVGQNYFRQAQSYAFQGMLEDPDLDVVRSFLLMAFYLLGECRRNAAFMYLGIATRAAVALGLHSRESYQDLSDPKDNLRLRVWISLRIVDMLVNSILGRPAATAGLTSDVDTILSDLEHSHTKTDEMARLIASHQIVLIINGIVERLYEKKEISTPVVESLLKEIEDWSQGLPKCVKSPAKASTMPGEHIKGTIGSVHVSCLYYFAVTLVTRPILISSLTAAPTSGALVHSQLASACLDAASFLVQACVEAKKANILYGNMCIMKALVFAAGLVLGFEIFAKRSIEYDIEAAFNGARDVLSFLAEQSPQAGHYYEILTLLSNAISKQRENVATAGRSRYVSKIFTLQEEEKELPSRRVRQDREPLLSWGLNSALDDTGIWLNGTRTPADDHDVFLGWDTLDISQWDNFPFVT